MYAQPLITRALAVLLLAGLLLSGLTLQAQERVTAPHIEVSLLSEVDGVQPGQPFYVGVYLNPEQGWHTYWQNPGDTGLPTRISWTLPDGAAIGELQWPYPQRADYQGLTNYGYERPALLMAEISPPTDFAGQVFPVAASVNWLVCEEVCIPGRAELSLDLPVANATPGLSSDADLFSATRQEHPQSLTYASASFQLDARLVVEVEGVATEVLEADSIRFFPMANGYIQNAVAPVITRTETGLRIEALVRENNPRFPNVLDGLLVLENPGEPPRALQFTAQPVAGLIAGSASAGLDYGVLTILLFALLGGLILNLMPCVFPVLSLKALSIVESRDYSAADRRQHGLVYTGGVVLGFLAIAALLLSLRAAGEQVGWGFQLQSPVFVAVLAYLLFVLGLSLSGVLEIGTALTRLGNLTQGVSGRAGSFWTGMLAVVVATPCTAPFMGTAMGVALTLPVAISLLVFGMLGLGMALPILAVSFIPAIAHWFPKPGRWMETFKEFLAFPLYLTVIWLLWVLARQTDANTLAMALIGLTLVAFAAWAWGRAKGSSRPGFSRGVALVAALLAISLIPLQIGAQRTPPMLESQPWSEAVVETARAQGRPVFVNFTADWCITCKVNERAVLETERMADFFRRHDVAYFKGDWTNADDNITRVLERHGRSGVPLYLFYVPGESQPRVLPQILTPGALISVLEPEAL